MSSAQDHADRPPNYGRLLWSKQTIHFAALLVAGSLCDLNSGQSAEQPEGLIDWVAARSFWSFRTPQPQTLPAVTAGHWPQRRIDYFVLSALERNGLEPSAPADRFVWLRRVHFVLTGLPPQPEAIAEFLSDTRSNAEERVVDALLASPRFGERLATLWLNLARYAEDQAHQVGNDTKHFYPNAWLYRAWVVRAFNEDRPYDDFIRNQIAADVAAESDTNNLPALGFLGLGPKYYNRGKLEVMADEWEDRVDTVSRTFLGLTVACARCHDHKFDPITMRDYYALAGVFASTRMFNRSLEPEPTSDGATSEAGNETAQAKKDVNKQDVDADPEKTMHIVAEGDPRNLHIFLRGDVDNPGLEVPRSFLRVLCEQDPQPFAHGSGRADLAEAICNPHNPLTARVMVNRLWELVFGRGLVGTPSNFGQMGDRPTHPELLDDLAIRFVATEWRIKPLLREMVLSATFRQTSQSQARYESVDPANLWLWRMPRRRLSVEMWRDAILSASGALEDADGPSLEISDPNNRRRTLYSRISRLELDRFLMQFDYPDANVHNARRAVTTTPMQKLFVLNNPFVIEQAGRLADRLHEEIPGSNLARLQHAYVLLYGRPARPSEIELGLRFLSEAAEGSLPAWTQFTQALLAANEMMFLD